MPVQNRVLLAQAPKRIGRVAAAVFLCPDGAGLYPAYAGFDQDLQAVAVLVDLGLLSYMGGNAVRTSAVLRHLQQKCASPSAG